MHKHKLIITLLVVWLGLGLSQPSTANALAGARSGTNGQGDVFLGGNYIEVGISASGSFGTAGAKPDGFFGTASRNNIGMSTNPDGFGEGVDRRMDFFLPGSPEERWVVGYKQDASTYAGSNAQLSGTVNIPSNTVTNTSTGDILSATSLGTFNSTLEVEQKISFGVDDKFFKNQVTLKNISGDTIESVRYMRSFDPDNTVDQSGSYTTQNEVTATYAEDQKAVVVARAIDGDPVLAATGSRSPIFFYSSDSRAVASAFGFGNGDPYTALAYDSPRAKNSVWIYDGAITIAFDVGNLAPNQSQTIIYYTSLDNRDFSEVLEDISQAEQEDQQPEPTPTPSPTPAPESNPNPSPNKRCASDLRYCPNAGPSILMHQAVGRLGTGQENRGGVMVEQTANSQDLFVEVSAKPVDFLFEDRSEADKIPVPWSQGLNLASSIFELKGFNASDGNQVGQTNQGKYIVMLAYNPDLLYGKDPSQLRIAWFNSETKRWEVLANNTVVKPFEQLVANVTDKFGYFSVVYPQSPVGTTQLFTRRVGDYNTVPGEGFTSNLVVIEFE